MTRVALIAALFASACVILPEDLPDGGGGVPDSGSFPPPPRDGGGTGRGGGGGGGDGGGFFDGGGGLFDGGTVGGTPVPGSGKDGDRGTGVLVLVRVDRGTANLAAPLEGLVKAVTGALTQAGLAVTSIAVADLYRTSTLWAARADFAPPVGLAAAIEAASASAGTSPQTCTTASLSSLGGTFPWINANGVYPFNLPPAALLVVLVDSGARPLPLAQCPASFGDTDPAAWLQLNAPQLLRARTRFALVGTSETETDAQMQKRCLAVPAFPVTALDALAPSPVPFFGNFSTRLTSDAAGLADSSDLCEALGSGVSAHFNAFAASWYTVLAASR